MAALLAYLGCQRSLVSRDGLAALLRPDAPPDEARAYLRRLIHRTREAFPQVDEALTSDAQRVLWTGECDVRDFLDACDMGCFDVALEIHRGALLQGAGALGEDAIDAWLDDERVKLQKRWRTAVMGAHRRCTVPRRRAELLQRLLDDDPADEDGVHFSLRHAISPEERDIALAGLQILQRTMALDLGLKPSAETLALGEALRSRPASEPTEPRAGATHGAPSAHADLSPVGRGVLIGRSDDLRALRELLRRPHGGVVTVLGPGGVGKTELVRHLADLLVEEGRPVFWVDLSAVAASSVPTALAQALQFVPEEGDLLGQLDARLRAATGTVVMDNFETVAAAGHLLSRWSSVAAGLRWLATSREALGIGQETIYRLRGLATDGEAPAAMELFRHHAQRHGTALTHGDEESVRRIIDMLDGVPLGIELAASWLPLMSPEEVAQELRTDLGRMHFAHGVRRDAHRSLRAVFDASWRRLDGDERAALSGLTVFRAPFDRRTAQEVAACEPAVLLRLLAKSMVHRLEHEAFVLHGSVRQFAAEACEPQSLAAPRERHTRIHLSLVSEGPPLRLGHFSDARSQRLRARFPDIESAWRDAIERGWFDRLYGALPNLSAHLIQTGRFEDLAALAGEAEAAVEPTHGFRDAFATAVAISMVLGARFEDGAFRVAKLMSSHSVHSMSMDLYFARHFIAAATGDRGEAVEVARAALEFAKATGDETGILRAWYILGISEFDAGRPGEATSCFEEMLEMATALGSESQAARALASLGDVMVFEGDAHGGLVSLHRAAQFFEACGDPLEKSYVRRYLAHAYRRAGDHASQLDFARSALQAARMLPAEFNEITCQIVHARALADLGFESEAVSDLVEALRRARSQRLPVLALASIIELCAVDRSLDDSTSRRVLAFASGRPELRPWDRVALTACAEARGLARGGQDAPVQSDLWSVVDAVLVHWTK